MMRVKSDRYNKIKEEYAEYGMSDHCMPVDLYGKRVFPNKGDKGNLEAAGQDIKEFYDLEGDYGLKGGE